MGAVTEARTWFPLRIPSSPVVTGPSLGAVVVVVAVAGAGAALTTVLSPTTDTALSVTVTGTSTLTIAWLPDAMPSSPLVVGASAGAAGAGAGAVTGAGGSPTTVLSPMTDTALSTMSTGADTSMRAWLPDRSPSSPVVSVAFATVAPNSVMPPARSVPTKARLMKVCMISP